MLRFNDAISNLRLEELKLMVIGSHGQIISNHLFSKDLIGFLPLSHGFLPIQD
jgi:hypothetical protein